MSRILEFLVVIVRKFETLVLYFIERFSANFQNLSKSIQIAAIVFLILAIIFTAYAVVLILRLFFKHSLRNLRNVQTEYQIVLNREEGKRCNFMYEILYFQKVVIIDEEVVLRAPLIEEVKVKKKKKKLIKLPMKKDRVQTHPAPLLDPSEDVFIIDFIKLNRRMVTSTFFIVVTLVTMLFQKYHDFDVIFRGLYMLKYENYIFIDNVGSWLFMVGFLVSILMTLFIWIYFYTRGSWQDKLNMRVIYDSFDIISIVPTFVAVLTVLNTFVISPATVTHTSMEPNYFEGDNVFIVHLAKYDQFDVVVVLAEEGDYNPSTDTYSMNEYYIKRIIGVPGDIVYITDGVIYVNGILIDDSEYLKLNTQTYCTVGVESDPDESCTFVVPEGEYFLLGDNRGNSYDSRQVGTFKEDELYGVVIFKVG